MTVQHDSSAKLKAMFAAVSQHAPAGDDCPAAERLWAVLRREIAASERRDVIDHLSTCPTCAEAWRLARELGAEAPESLDSQRRTKLRPWQHPSWTAVAAALLILVGFGIYRIGTSNPEPEPGFRDSGQHEIRSQLPEGRPFSRENGVLRWSEGPQGTRYDLHVTTDDLTTVLSARSLTESEYRIPEENLLAVEAGARLFWRVTAVLPDGERLHSQTFVSELK